MPWFGQAIDGADGQLSLGRRWTAPWRRTLRMNWNPSRSEKAVGGLIAMHQKLSRATNGRAIVPPTWTVLRNLVTPHPLGGCNMASGPAAGVVDHACRVFGHAGLYVMDGSAIPRPLGLNPSKTIAAVAERATELMLADSSQG
jgi:cholesterol oxidase